MSTFPDVGAHLWREGIPEEGIPARSKEIVRLEHRADGTPSLHWYQEKDGKLGKGNLGKSYRRKRPVHPEGNWNPWMNDETWDMLEAKGLLNAIMRVYRRWMKRAGGKGLAEDSEAIRKTISEDAGCVLRTVITATESLKDAGLLESHVWVEKKKTVIGFRVQGYKLPPKKAGETCN